MRKKFTQRQLLTYTANMQTSLIGLEACSGAHFLGRALRKQGHDVWLIAAQFVKPFVKSNKNDFVDAEAIAEAVERKNMRFVPIKTDDQLDLQAIHRVRDRLISRRTAVIHQLRAVGRPQIHNHWPDSAGFIGDSRQSRRTLFSPNRPSSNDTRRTD